jgi:hypothetical protein
VLQMNFLGAIRILAFICAAQSTEAIDLGFAAAISICSCYSQMI